MVEIETVEPTEHVFESTMWPFIIFWPLRKNSWVRHCLHHICTSNHHTQNSVSMSKYIVKSLIREIQNRLKAFFDFQMHYVIFFFLSKCIMLSIAWNVRSCSKIYVWSPKAFFYIICYCFQFLSVSLLFYQHQVTKI